MSDAEEQRRETAERKRKEGLWPYSKRPFDFRKVSPAAFAEAFGIALSDRCALAAIDPDQSRTIEDAEVVVCDALHRALSVFDDDASEGGPARAAFVDYVFPLVLRFRDSDQVSRVKGLWEKWRSVVKVCRGQSKALPAQLVEQAEAAGRESIKAARLALSRLFEELHPAKQRIWFVRYRLESIAKHYEVDDPPKGILEAEAEALEALRPLAWGQPGAEEVAATRTALDRLAGALAKGKGKEWKNKAQEVRGLLKLFGDMPETAPTWFHLPRFDVPDFDFDKIDFTGLSSPGRKGKARTAGTKAARKSRKPSAFDSMKADIIREVRGVGSKTDAVGKKVEKVGETVESKIPPGRGGHRYTTRQTKRGVFRKWWDEEHDSKCFENYASMEDRRAAFHRWLETEGGDFYNVGKHIDDKEFGNLWGAASKRDRRKKQKTQGLKV